MSKYLVIASLSFFFMAAPAQSATKRAETPFGPFWKDVRQLINRCAIQPVVTTDSGRQVIQDLVSICGELQVFEEGAALTVKGKKYFAYIRDSKFADYGDLNDLEVQDAHGELVGRRSNIPAFGDVLLALAGGDAEITVPQILIKE